jgi:hypothetical protein
MVDVLAVLEKIRGDLSGLATAISNAETKSIATSMAQPVATSSAKEYFEHVRPELSLVGVPERDIEEIDTLFQVLLELASARSPKRKYPTLISDLSQCLLSATVDLMRARGSRRLVLSATERFVLSTLERMLPSCSASYEQVLRDISVGDRISWRGTANELREILREVIDHLAPDAQVLASGIQLEKNQKGPTQKQKVRFILKARQSSSAARTSAETSLETVDEMVATLARDTYTRSSASAHTATNAPEIRKLKRYVEALLADFLEIS